MQLDRITPRAVKFDQWYTDVVGRARLMSYGPVAGTMIIQPNGWMIWETIQKGLDAKFKALGVSNVAMPLLIPLELFNREKEHVAGFAPELFLVERVGDYKLPAPYAIRPTSEVVFSMHFADIVRSHRDLPLLYNQWCSVMRAEKTTRPFLRSSEFHWQEGHTVHADAKEALRFARSVARIYARFARDVLCLPVMFGYKTPNERFAGAEQTFTLEAVMQDGKALQCATSHYFGQNFTKAYGIKFQNAANKVEFAYQTSWGLSTRIIGAVIMVHGDDRGVALPPDIAPCQVAVLTLFADKDPSVLGVANDIVRALRRYRVKLDATSKGLGYKLAEQEVVGTPLRIEIGPEDVKNGVATLSNRIGATKQKVTLAALAATVKKALAEYKKELRQRALASQRIAFVDDYAAFKTALAAGGFVVAPWAGDAADEARLKAETTATARCVPERPIKKMAPGTKCFFTGRSAAKYVVFAVAY